MISIDISQSDHFEPVYFPSKERNDLWVQSERRLSHLSKYIVAWRSPSSRTEGWSWSFLNWGVCLGFQLKADLTKIIYSIDLVSIAAFGIPWTGMVTPLVTWCCVVLRWQCLALLLSIWMFLLLPPLARVLFALLFVRVRFDLSDVLDALTVEGLTSFIYSRTWIRHDYWHYCRRTLSYRIY